jgi:undecaprenyl diphosphate synthase
VEKNHSAFPKHVAIIMDGNGRWAAKRFLPRIMGHRAGAKAVRKAIDFCHRHDIPILTLFALSVENLSSRPQKELTFLVELFITSLKSNLQEMHKNGICIRFIGDLSVFDEAVQAQARASELLTKDNMGLKLVIAINYSGRWDILQAAKQFSRHLVLNHLDAAQSTEKDYAQFLSLSDLPEPDLMIRTSGEKRMSNFLLWQLAYTELCFIDEYWPDFDESIFARAIADFQKRERRFGLTGEQVRGVDGGQ